MSLKSNIFVEVKIDKVDFTIGVTESCSYPDEVKLIFIIYRWTGYMIWVNVNFVTAVFMLT